MSVYRLAVEAERDIEEVLQFTIRRWGWEQSERYGRTLHDAFTLLSGMPGLGRNIAHIRPGYRRFERGSHSIDYVEH